MSPQRGAGQRAGATEQPSEEEAAALAALAELPDEERAELVALAEAGVDLSGLANPTEPAEGEGQGDGQAGTEQPPAPQPSAPAPEAIAGRPAAATGDEHVVAPNSSGAKETPPGENPHEALAKRAGAAEEAALTVEPPAAEGEPVVDPAPEA